MKKPKYTEKRKIDSWICCWCGEDNPPSGGTKDLDYDMGNDVINCCKCGKENFVMFSIEFTSQPIED